MPVHLVKLAAGISDFAALQVRLAERVTKHTNGQNIVPVFTRNRPKRGVELLEGGSLYWIAGGYIVGRNSFVDIQEGVDKEGRKYCLLCVAPEIIRVQSTPRRAFQGWRYLPDTDIPRDILTDVSGREEGPAELLNELQKLGLL